MIYVYILYSPKLNGYYIGHTNDLKDRIYRHNHGYEKYTKNYIPWKLVWSTSKANRSEATKLEAKLKNLNMTRLNQSIEKYG